MQCVAYVTSLYGVFLIVFGIFGYLKSASWHSLLSGIVIGLVVNLFFPYLYRARPLAIRLMAIFLPLLEALFVYRAVKTQKFYPSGIIALVTTFTCAYFFIRLSRRWLAKRS